MAKEPTHTRDHGGNLDAAIARFGGDRTVWLDLSTGINPQPYPLPSIPPEAWAVLPRRTEMESLCAAARLAYDTQASVIPFAGAQAAIQALPWITDPGTAKVLGPTYNEHAAAFRMGKWTVSEVPTFQSLAGAKCAVVVNPNNPGGQSYTPQDLIELASTVDYLIVDESFADPSPALSVAPHLQGAPDNVIVLRSFGKFYGLAGLRLGFALASGSAASRLAGLAGPWPVSGPALTIAGHALADTAWQRKTTARLKRDAERLDHLAFAAGWSLVGGTPLFRTYQAPNAVQAQAAMARQHVWSRIFPYSQTWVRLGLPPEDRWDQVRQALLAAR
ncbi:MAG: threonine-phosphate decarboxylase CobD [Rhodobacteraceae bacterium]|nr:threonine-phosphate decarboxylase CobD [Paracoccaceae bacterium]